MGFFVGLAGRLNDILDSKEDEKNLRERLTAEREYDSKVRLEDRAYQREVRSEERGWQQEDYSRGRQDSLTDYRMQRNDSRSDTLDDREYQREVAQTDLLRRRQEMLTPILSEVRESQGRQQELRRMAGYLDYRGIPEEVQAVLLSDYSQAEEIFNVLRTDGSEWSPEEVRGIFGIPDNGLDMGEDEPEVDLEGVIEESSGLGRFQGFDFNDTAGLMDDEAFAGLLGASQTPLGGASGVLEVNLPQSERPIDPQMLGLQEKKVYEKLFRFALEDMEDLSRDSVENTRLQTLIDDAAGGNQFAQAQLLKVYGPSVAAEITEEANGQYSGFWQNFGSNPMSGRPLQTDPSESVREPVVSEESPSVPQVPEEASVAVDPPTEAPEAPPRVDPRDIKDLAQFTFDDEAELEQMMGAYPEEFPSGRYVRIGEQLFRIP